MSDNPDRFVDGLQNQIYEDTRSAYGERAFERWQNMRHNGTMENPDGTARVTGPCGDTVEVFLKFQDDCVQEASFQTDGCGNSAVCGSFAVEIAIDKTPDELIEITGESILELLGGFPKEDRHCAFLAAETLQEALNNYMIKQRESRQRRGQ